MLRRLNLFTVVLAAASLTGCLGSFGSPGSSTGPGGSQQQNPMNNGSGGGNGGGGGGGGGGAIDMGSAPTFDLAGPPAMTGSLGLSLDSTSASIRMNDTKDLNLTITPKDGFDGIVTLSAENLPAGVTATFTPPGGMLSGTDPMTVKVTLTSASNTKPQTGISLDVKATSGAITATTPLTLDVQAELLIVIAKGVNIGTKANPNLEAFGAQSIPTYFVAPGTKVTFINEDTINHEIHSDGTLGISHEGGPLMANEGNSYTQTFNGTGTFNFHCHIHTSMVGQIVVQPLQ